MLATGNEPAFSPCRRIHLFRVNPPKGRGRWCGYRIFRFSGESNGNKKHLNRKETEEKGGKNTHETVKKKNPIDRNGN